MKIISVFIILLTFASCTHQYYVPTYQPVPNVNHTNDLQGTVGFLANKNFKGPQVSLSYIVAKKVALNFLYTDIESNLFTPLHNSAKGQYWEWTAEYLQALNKNAKLIVGFGNGMGQQYHNYVICPFLSSSPCTSSIIGNSNLHFNKYYFQSGLIKHWKNTQLSFSTRLSKLYFDDIFYKNVMDSEFYAGYKGIETNRRPLILEPQFEIRVGSKRVQFMESLQFAKLLNAPAFDIANFAFSTSLYFNLHKP